MRKFRTKNARNRERIKLALKVAGGLVVLVFVLGLAAYGTHHPKLRIQTAYIKTDGLLSQEALQDAVAETLSGKFFGIVPKDSFFFVRSNSLAAVLESSFPRIRNVQARRAGLQALSVSINERSPEALWCGDVVPPVAYEYRLGEGNQSEDVWGTCYLMDADAHIYAKAPMYTGDVFLRYYGALSQADPVGQNFISSDEFGRWQDIYHEMQDNEHVPKAILIVDERDMELYLKGALRVLATRSEDTSVTHSHLIATLASGVLDESRAVEYLDLRFGSKAYVKYVYEESDTE